MGPSPPLSPPDNPIPPRGSVPSHDHPVPQSTPLLPMVSVPATPAQGFLIFAEPELMSQKKINILAALLNAEQTVLKEKEQEERRGIGERSCSPPQGSPSTPNSRALTHGEVSGYGQPGEHPSHPPSLPFCFLTTASSGAGTTEMNATKM